MKSGKYLIFNARSEKDFENLLEKLEEWELTSCSQEENHLIYFEVRDQDDADALENLITELMNEEQCEIEGHFESETY